MRTTTTTTTNTTTTSSSFDWKLVLGSEYKEQKAKPPTEEELASYLSTAYGSAKVDVPLENTDSNLGPAKAQVDVLCDKMKALGFTSFEGLRNKFTAPITTTFRNTSNAKQTKIFMEYIVHFIENSPPEKQAALVQQFKDRKFACGEGTLTNLIAIYTEMTQGRQDVKGLATFAKRQMVEQIILEMHRDNMFAPDFPKSAGMEVHDVQSLVNAVADEYGLQPKTKEEDAWLKDASKFKDMVKQAVDANFNDPDKFSAITDIIANQILFSLPETAAGNGPDINRRLEELGFDGSYSTLTTLDEADKAKNYKHNRDEIVRDLVKIWLHEQGILKDRDIDFTKRKQELEKSGYDDENFRSHMCVSKECIEGDLTERDWEYILKNGVALDGRAVDAADEDERGFGTTDPFEYCVNNNITIKGKSVVRYFIDNDILINGQEPRLYLLENSEIDALEGINQEKLNQLLFEYESAKAIKNLIEKGASLNTRNKNGYTRLHVAIDQGQKDIVAEILKHPEGRALLKVKDNNSKTPLHIAAFANRKEIVAEILKHLEGRETLKEKDYERRTPLHIAAFANRKEIVAEILKHPEGRALLKVKDAYNKTPLHVAIIERNKEIVAEILKHPEGINTLKEKDNNGHTSLHLAASKGHRDVVAEILKHPEGRELLKEKDNNGKALLHEAVAQGNKNIVSEILKCQEGINTLKEKSPNGHTPLHIAVYQGRKDVVTEILKHPEGRETLKERDNNGQTPLRLAIEKGHKDIVKAILQTEEGRQEISLRDVLNSTGEMREMYKKAYIRNWASTAHGSMISGWEILEGAAIAFSGDISEAYENKPTSIADERGRDREAQPGPDRER